ncbi:MAG: OmpH family outer membrane protein [Candidatus Binatia bacterium]
MILKATTFLAAMILVISAAGITNAEGLKLGYVITQRLLLETDVGRRAYEKLEGEMKTARASVQEKMSELQDLEEDMRKRAMVLSDEEKQRLAEQYEKGMVEAKRLNEDFEGRFKKTQAEVMAKVQDHIRKVIDKYASANGYDILFDASTLVYVSTAADITDEVIEAANRSDSGK